jgi:hypothetical protein
MREHAFAGRRVIDGASLREGGATKDVDKLVDGQIRLERVFDVDHR